MFALLISADERTAPVYNYQVDSCGPVHLTMGDGGNIEKLYKVRVLCAHTPRKLLVHTNSFLRSIG